MQTYKIVKKIGRNILSQIFSRPYVLFFCLLFYIIISTYIKLGLKEALILILYDLVFLVIAKLIFRKIGDRLIFIVTRNNKSHKVLGGYLFIFTFYFPWISLLIA